MGRLALSRPHGLRLESNFMEDMHDQTQFTYRNLSIHIGCVVTRRPMMIEAMLIKATLHEAKLIEALSTEAASLKRSL